MDHLQPGTLFKEGERKHTHTHIHTYTRGWEI